MNSGKKKSILPYIPGYDNNTVLKLIFFVSGAYIMLAITWAVIMLVYGTTDVFNTYFLPNIALPALKAYPNRWWTIFTYGLFQLPNSFMELLSNMLWLYCFGSVTQMLVGKKQIVPLFMYSILMGGVCYLLVQLLPGEFRHTTPYVLGSRAGIVGMCAAAITLSPNYRFYLSDTFSIPMAVVAGIFGVLMILGSGFYVATIVMLLGGGLMGFAYVKLLKAGYRPGEWMYSLGNKVESLVTPNEQEIARKQNSRRNAVLNNIEKSEATLTQKRIDDILDKINQKGYEALSKEEREFLMRAGKE